MKKGAVETTKEDFDSLPPALRRKVSSLGEMRRIETFVLLHLLSLVFRFQVSVHLRL